MRIISHKFTIAYALFSLGATVKEVSREFGVPRSSCYRYHRRYRNLLPNRKRQWTQGPALAAKRGAAFEMFKNKIPITLVARAAGISRATSYRWAKKYSENPSFFQTTKKFIDLF